MGVKQGVLGGCWGFLTRWSYFTLKKIPWKFHVDIFNRSVSGMRGQGGGYLDDIESSWPGTWRTGSSLCNIWSCLTLRKEDTLKVSCWYLYGKCVRKGGGQEGFTWRTLRVPDRILGGQGHLWCHKWCFFTLRKIPRKFRVDIFMGSVSRRGGVKKRGTWRTLRVLDQRRSWCTW